MKTLTFCNIILVNNNMNESFVTSSGNKSSGDRNVQTHAYISRALGLVCRAALKMDV